MSGRLDPEPLPRRDFLGLSGMLAAGAAIFGSLIGMARLPKPRVLPEENSRLRVGSLEEYPVGTETAVPGRSVYIRSTTEGIAALSLICTHLGCVVSQSATGFDCPCHGSRFGPAGGVLRGPAPRALRWLEISRAADGGLVVDLEREVPAGKFFKA